MVVAVVDEWHDSQSGLSALDTGTIVLACISRNSGRHAVIEQDQVNAAIDALERAKEQPPVKSYATQREAVEAMREHIEELHKRGWSAAAIAKVISDAGIRTTPAIVGNILKPRVRRRRRRTVSTPETEPLST